jgi:hypothetical protein
MFIKLLEICEEIINYNKAEGIKSFFIREIAINPNYITSFRTDTLIERLIKDNPSSAEGLQKDQKFTRVYINKGGNSQEIVVLGDINTIYKLLDTNSNKKVIKG